MSSDKPHGDVTGIVGCSLVTNRGDNGVTAGVEAIVLYLWNASKCVQLCSYSVSNHSVNLQQNHTPKLLTQALQIHLEFSATLLPNIALSLWIERQIYSHTKQIVLIFRIFPNYACSAELPAHILAISLVAEGC